MNFALDLLDSVTDPRSALDLVLAAAREGHHLVVRRWCDDLVEALEPHTSPALLREALTERLGRPVGEVTQALLEMSARSDVASNNPSAEVFGQWLGLAHRAQAVDLDALLRRCVVGGADARCTLASAGRQLLALGADPLAPLRPNSHEQRVELPRTRIDQAERCATLLARAIDTRHPLAQDMLTAVCRGKDPWPVVAQLEIAGQWHPVHAASYAVASGNLAMVRDVASRFGGDDHLKAKGLAQAVDFALSSGLVQGATPEVAQGMAVCIANGADLDHAGLGRRLIGARASLASEVSDSAYGAAREYRLAALFLSAQVGREALDALTKLVNDYGLEINEAATADGTRASFLHYAAALGDANLVSGLCKLGADAQARDARGLQPADYAEVFERADVLKALGRGAPEPQAPPVASQREVDEQDAHAEDGPPVWHEDIPLDEDEARLATLDADDTQAPEALEAPDVGADVAGPGRGGRAPREADEAPARDQVASAVDEAQASRGAALFARLKSSQLDLATRREAAALSTASSAPAAAPAAAAGRRAHRSGTPFGA